MRELTIRVERPDQREPLLRFLSDCGAKPTVTDERAVQVDLDDAECPALATLVASLEDWRSHAHAAETVLELDGETRILRTEA